MNIDKIDIVNNGIRLTIIPNENKLIKKDNTTTITDEEIDTFFDIISTWKDNYYSSNGLDGNNYTVRIFHDHKIDTFKAIRKVPSNYNEFHNFVRTLNDRR